jgi:hypothetical protein
LQQSKQLAKASELLASKQAASKLKKKENNKNG